MFQMQLQEGARNSFIHAVKSQANDEHQKTHIIEDEDSEHADLDRLADHNPKREPLEPFELVSLTDAEIITGRVWRPPPRHQGNQE